MIVFMDGRLRDYNDIIPRLCEFYLASGLFLENTNYKNRYQLHDIARPRALQFDHYCTYTFIVEKDRTVH